MNRIHSPGRPPTKEQQPYNAGRWTDEEHNRFLQGLERHGKVWKSIATVVQTRSVVQVRTHAQKHFLKMNSGDSSTTQSRPPIRGKSPPPVKATNTIKKKPIKCSKPIKAVRSSHVPKAVALAKSKTTIRHTANNEWVFNDKMPILPDANLALPEDSLDMQMLSNEWFVQSVMNSPASVMEPGPIGNSFSGFMKEEKELLAPLVAEMSLHMSTSQDKDPFWLEDEAFENLVETM